MIPTRRTSPPRIRLRVRVAALVLAGLATCLPVAAQDLSLRGRVELKDDGDDETRKEFRSAIVWYQPLDVVVEPPEAPAEPFDMVTVRKEFQPRVLPVPIGSTVRFPNQDPILHNVFSVSGANRFDLGLYRGGDSKETRFDQAGIVHVFCNVHHSMVAYVAVLETPFYSRIDRDGRFSIEGLPAGRGRLTVWHERAEVREIDLTLPTSDVSVTLDLSKPRIPRHRNKFGKPYSRTRRGKAY